jgi:hypothetical protein
MKYASEKQVNFINKLIEKKGTNRSWSVIHRFDVDNVEQLTVGEASYVINTLLEMDDFNEAAYAAAQQRGLDRYEQLVAWCKENGVKGVRSRMKTVNIMKLIREAGLTAPAELVR